MGRRPSFRLACLVALLSLPAAALRAEPGTVLASVADGAAWQLAAPEAARSGPVHETRWWLSRPPGSDADRVQVHRYRVPGASRAVLLYLPGTYMNGESALAGSRHGLFSYLAEHGVETWALDYRTHFVPPEGMRSPEDHAFMRDWTLGTFVDDARAAAALARRESGRARVFVAGFSRGATLAFGVACSEPSGIAGLVVLDGFFKHATASDFDLAAERAALFEASHFSTDVAGGIGWPQRQRLMAAAAADPQGPALASPDATVGAQLARILHDAWRPGALADAVAGVSRPEMLARLLEGYDRYWPAVQNVEGQSIASRPDDPATAIDDAWGELAVPVLYFGATNMGPGWILDGVYSAVESGSDDVTLNVLEGYGHLDVLVGEHARDEVYAPLTRWILERSPGPERPSEPVR